MEEGRAIIPDCLTVSYSRGFATYLLSIRDLQQQIFSCHQPTAFLSICSVSYFQPCCQRRPWQGKDSIYHLWGTSRKCYSKGEKKEQEKICSRKKEFW
jgi:hypothetical protein